MAILRRINMDSDYLIAAPKPEPETGFYLSWTERAYLVDNIINFLERHPDVNPHQVTIYELVQVNGKIERG